MSSIRNNDSPVFAIERVHQLLQEAGALISIPELIAIIDGVNASALPQDDNSWLDMVDCKMDEDLVFQLMEIRRIRAIDQNDSEKSGSKENRINKLRRELAELSLNGFLLPRADEYQGEYLPKCSERLRWLTGFDGSAGFAIILLKSAAIFTDGRYKLQIQRQVDQTCFEIFNLADISPIQWLEKSIGKHDKIGFDPWLHTSHEIENFTKKLEPKNGHLVALPRNPIDAIWDNRPPTSLGPIFAHPNSYSGELSSTKVSRINKKLLESGEDALVVTSPESIAWVLNIRGSDVPRTPLPLSFMILDCNETVQLFVDERKVNEGTRKHLGNLVSILPVRQFGSTLDELVARGKKIRIDPKSSPYWVKERIQSSSGIISPGEDPILIPKALKNKTELAGARAAHIRDGAAFVRFLNWFSENAKSENLDEMSVAEKLKSFRSEDNLFKDLSFDTISGSGPNGAIIHYRVTKDSNRVIRLNDLYLVDSGAQYLDGTTDITRTIAVGNPGDKARDYFTRVLKGHIAIATSKFPRGTTGSQLDSLARVALWNIGADYDHGTGHGVGSYLGVHEGPQRISKTTSTVELRPGMIISNEPGFYAEGAYGIRLENLVVVQTEERLNNTRDMLSFETITLVPFDTTMIIRSLMTDDEIRWLNAYHLRVRRQLTPLLNKSDGEWLLNATTEIK